MLIAWIHKIAPDVVYPAVTSAGYSSPAPGLCGANRHPESLVLLGGCHLRRTDCGRGSPFTPARLCPSGRLPNPSHDPLGRLPAHTRTHRHLLAGAEWLREPERRRGAVRCGAEGCHTVRGSAARFVVVTGGPVSQRARWELTGSDGFATPNATARARHRA